jgi:hypothetical protein
MRLGLFKGKGQGQGGPFISDAGELAIALPLATIEEVNDSL